MSYITGTPAIEEILSSFSPEELERLTVLINNKDAKPVGSYRTYSISNLKPDFIYDIVEEDKDFAYVNLSFDPVSQGYQVGILTSGGIFISWTPDCKNMIEVFLTPNWQGDLSCSYEYINEQLTTEEFRRVLYDVSSEKGAVVLSSQTYEDKNGTFFLGQNTIDGAGLNIDGSNTHIRMKSHSAAFNIENDYGSDFIFQRSTNAEDEEPTYYDYRFPNKSGTFALTSDLDNINIPNGQNNVVFIKGFRENLNGKVLSTYEDNLTEQMIALPSFTLFLVCQITKGGEKLTEEQAKLYMKYMCGSEYLPKYNYDFPRNTLFIMKNDGSCWKPQYDNTNGLLLWYVADNFTRNFEINSSSRFEEIEIFYKYHPGNILVYSGFLNGDDNDEPINNLPLTIIKFETEETEGGEVVEPAKIWASASDVVNNEPVMYYLYWAGDSQPIVTKKVLAEATPAQAQ